MTATLERPPSTLPPTAAARLSPVAPGPGGWSVTLLVTLVAGVLRFVRLALPTSGGDHNSGKIFDEVYYACDAQNLLRFGVEHNTRSDSAACIPTPGGAFIVHPPLGKWAIALGEQLFGVNTFGWRFPSAVAGTLTVLLVVRIGRRMTGSSLLGGLAGLLLSLDGLHFVQSRVAMLDIFLCLWLTAAFGALVVDRDAFRARLARGAPPGPRPWRVLAGVCLGAALSTKWSALYLLAVLVPLAFWWDVAARRTAGVRSPARVTARRTTAGWAASLLVLPGLLYVGSWAGWFLTRTGYDRTWAAKRSSIWRVPAALRSWWHYHAEIYHFHETLTLKHPYQSHPASWVVLGRPVSYYYPSGISRGHYGCAVSSCAREVLALGTPALWWAIVPACLGLLALWVVRRDWRASVLLLGVLAGIVPWEPSDLKHRTMFLFYALPSIPFLCLGIAVLAGWAMGSGGTRRRKVAAAVTGIYTSTVLVQFVALYPVLAAVTIPYDQWLRHMWLHSWI